MGIKIKAKCHQCGIRNVLDIEPAMTSGKIKNQSLSAKIAVQ